MANESKPSESKSKLYHALYQAQKNAHSVAKHGHNASYRANYARAEDIIKEANILHEYGLMLWCEDARIRHADGQWLYETKWRLAHFESGESICIPREWPIVPERGRPIDKAVATSDTTVMAYMIRDLLKLARVEPGSEMDDTQRDVDNMQAEMQQSVARQNGHHSPQKTTPANPAPAPQQQPPAASTPPVQDVEAQRRRYQEMVSRVKHSLAGATDEQLGGIPHRWIDDAVAEVAEARMPEAAQKAMREIAGFHWLLAKLQHATTEQAIAELEQRARDLRLSDSNRDGFLTRCHEVREALQECPA